jgi:heme-degrading monooxygenase HmoA
LNFALTEFWEVAPASRLCYRECKRSVGEREERREMHARMSIFEGPPDKLDEGVRHAREVILPQAKEMDPGFKGIIALTDRQSGKMLGITFWESEEALRASEEAANRLREGSAEAGGGTVAGVERYEVGLFEVPSGGPVSGVTEPVSGVTDTLRGTTDKLLGGGKEKQR